MKLRLYLIGYNEDNDLRVELLSFRRPTVNRYRSMKEITGYRIRAYAYAKGILT